VDARLLPSTWLQMRLLAAFGGQSMDFGALNPR